MYPELFKIPFTELIVKSYGLMMVIGFLSAVYTIRRLSRQFTSDPQHITNAALYALIAGVVGARVFYIVHYWERFRDDLGSVFSIWEGGLELLGGVIFSITVIILYMWRNKLPIRRYLDVLAIGLMAALAFGRIGCFLNGCCFGKPTDLAWAVRFPYGSIPYNNQIYCNPERERLEPYLKLPAGFSIHNSNGDIGISPGSLKSFSELTEEQKEMVTKGEYRALPIHPTQLYSSGYAFFCCGVLYFFWRRGQKAIKEKRKKFMATEGCTFGLMFVIYSIGRFLMEFVRDDNPFEINTFTISQLLSMAMIVFGVLLMLFFSWTSSRKTANKLT